MKKGIQLCEKNFLKDLEIGVEFQIRGVTSWKYIGSRRHPQIGILRYIQVL
jgi:hypothetical protein